MNKTTLGIASLSLFLSFVLTGINAAGKTQWPPQDYDRPPYYPEQHPGFGPPQNYGQRPGGFSQNPGRPPPGYGPTRNPNGNTGNKNEYIDEQELVKKYRQPDDVGRNLKYDNLNHNDAYLCTRDCKKYPKARLCYYIFNVEHYSTMGQACRNCSTGNLTDCSRRQCIRADGIERSVVSINRQIPGPTIDVCYGDRIVVDVVNKLATSALTIHWHGVLQRSTPWMDGVPFVTQCPINPNTRFRYDFPADTNGTLFYHAHIAHLHANGVYGALIVRHASSTHDPNAKLHDYDLPSHTIQISDWNHLPAEALFPGFYRNQSHYPEKPDLHLINGHGSYTDSKVTTNVPSAEFHVKCGKKYRFRIIASTTTTCSFKFAIQDHSMSVVALDGYPCNPLDVNTLVMSSGQRTDVIIKTNQGQNCKNKAYLIVVKGMDTCENLTNAQTANLIYDNTSSRPSRPRNLATIHNKAPYLNNHNINCTNPDNVCADTLPPADGFAGFVLDEGREVDRRFILRPDFYNYTLDELFETNTYSPFYVPFGPYGRFAAALSNVSGMLPPVPLLTQENDIPADMPICHGSCKNNESICRCVNILEVALNSLVEIQFERGIIHPIHLHGHHFTVVTPTNGTTATRLGGGQGTVQRDVVHVPLDGLARVRFLADNPGYWILHCHFNPHLDGGMFLVFKVGNSRNFKSPPSGFPKCGDFRASIENKYN